MLWFGFGLLLVWFWFGLSWFGFSLLVFVVVFLPSFSDLCHLGPAYTGPILFKLLMKITTKREALAIFFWATWMFFLFLHCTYISLSFSFRRRFFG